MNTAAQVKYAFQPVGKLDPGQQQRVMKVQKAAETFAEEILDLVPECADRTHALRIVLDAKFWATQAITHSGPTIQGQQTVEVQTKQQKGKQ